MNETAADTPVDYPPLELRDGVPPVIDKADALMRYADQLAAGFGPVALDAERASGYRYSQRAYLVQVRRQGAGSALIDPIALSDLAVLNEAIGEAEWILHAATQDLPCLAEVGMAPVALFDTELAARLLGRERVSLAALVGSELGAHLAKGHGATDWSVRPLSAEQLRYAALDVEPLVELREVLGAELAAVGREEVANQEFTHLLDFQPRDKGPEEWRRLSGMHKLRHPRQWAIARELWRERDDIAARGDIAPGRILPDSAIIAAVQAQPASQEALLATTGFHGRGAGRYARSWWAALRRGQELPESELPERTARGEGPPPPRAWPERNLAAHHRLQSARGGIGDLAQEWGVAPELMMAPDTIRRLCWQPPGDISAAAITSYLTDMSARDWQIEACLPILLAALANEVTSE